MKIPACGNRSLAVAAQLVACAAVALAQTPSNSIPDYLLFIDPIVNEAVQSGLIPGAVVLIGHNDQIMLVTDAGMVIRCPVHDIRIARRRSQGVVIFKLGDGERVVSVARLPEVSDENGEAVTEESPENQEANEGDL